MKFIFNLNKSPLKTVLILLAIPALLCGQETFFEDKIYQPNIKTVQLHRAGWDLTYPLMELNSADQLSLSFDDLCNEVKNYSYTIVHCDADWYPSGLSVEEYMSGFAHQAIHDYSLSFNTYVNYVHYRLKLPNEDVKILISGNYVIKVFEDFDENKLILVRRFSVSESLASITGNASRPVMDPYRDDGHQVSFKVYLGSLSIYDPYSEIKVAIQQNNRWNMCIRTLKPLFVRENELDYNYQSENIFKAGNEYRYFDIKSMRYMAEMVQNIEYKAPHHHVYLYPDHPRNNGRYFYREDLNGRFFIEVQEGVNRDTESDYVHVHFTLRLEFPIVDGYLYVSGSLNNWEYNEINRMEYNFDKKAYELNLLLKQGYYNYEYVHIRENSRFPDATYLEGRYYETENDYVVYVYLATNTSRYDRLIAYQILNSIRK